MTDCEDKSHVLLGGYKIQPNNDAVVKSRNIIFFTGVYSCQSDDLVTGARFRASGGLKCVRPAWA